MASISNAVKGGLGLDNSPSLTGTGYSGQAYDVAGSVIGSVYVGGGGTGFGASYQSYSVALTGYVVNTGDGFSKINLSGYTYLGNNNYVSVTIDAYVLDDGTFVGQKDSATMEHRTRRRFIANDDA